MHMRARMIKAGMIYAVMLFCLFFSKGQVDASGTLPVYKTSGSYTYCMEEDGTITIVGYTGNEETVNIPSEIDGLPVRSIDGFGDYNDGISYSYYVNNKTRKIIVPEGVVTIKKLNKYGASCMSVEEVYLPDSVTQIAEEAFCRCEKLKKVRLPSGLKKIEDATFYHCDSLKTIQLPNGLKWIGESAFEECTSLKEISIPDTVISVGKAAFFDCGNLQNVILSNNLTVIKDRTFAHCYKLRSIQLPKKLKRIETRAFVNTSITRVTIPENVVRIESSVFWTYKGKIKKVTIKSKKIKYFGKEAFTPKKGAVYDVPNSCIKKYKKMLIEKNCFTSGKMKIK